MRTLEIFKKIGLVILLMFAGVSVSQADVRVGGITLNSEYSVSGGRLNVTNLAAPTKFKCRVDLSRTMLGTSTNYADGTCTVTIVYRLVATGAGNEIVVSALTP